MWTYLLLRLYKTLFLEKVWHKEELLSSVDMLTVEALQNFIPRLLANVKVRFIIDKDDDILNSQ